MLSITELVVLIITEVLIIIYFACPNTFPLFVSAILGMLYVFFNCALSNMNMKSCFGTVTFLFFLKK